MKQAGLKRLLQYDPETGLFTWLVQVGKRAKIGSVVGSFDKDGYRVIQLGGQKYRAGRLAWFYMTGEWPEEIDHIDGVRDNDRWSNLREATRNDNVANAERELGESGFRGVKRDPKNPLLWRARVSYGYSRKWLGPFKTPEEAYEAYLAQAETLYGEFAVHNRESQGAI